MGIEPSKVCIGVFPKQELARHATPDMTMNVYGRARDEKMRETVEAVGNMLFDDSDNLKKLDHGREKTEH